MKKINMGQLLNSLANLGVIVGIAFLVIELSQNNRILAMEAGATQSQYMQDGWHLLATDPILVDLFIKDRSGQPLSEAEEFRLNAFWMGYLIRLEWQYLHAPDADVQNRIAALRRTYEAYGSFRRTWNGTNTSSRGAGKDNFSADFIRFVDQELARNS